MHQTLSFTNNTLSTVEKCRLQTELQNSVISLELQRVATEHLTDLEVSYGGDVSAPIAEALGFKYRRYGRQANETQHALSFVNEDGTIWQAKIFEADRADGRSGQYLAPVKNGDRAYLPAIDSETRQKISDRYGVDVPKDGSFWKWVENHPEIPIVITEGGKKALALLSQGYVAISLYGCITGTKLDENCDRDVIDDLKPFAQEGRKIAIAFDRDTNPKAKRAVAMGTGRLSWAFGRNGCEVVSLQWDYRDGKGVDDLIANKGVEAFETAYKQAKSLKQWQIYSHLETRLKSWQPTFTVNTADLSETITPDNLLTSGIFAIDSAKGTGKTKLLGKTLETAKTVLSLGHRVALQRNLADRLNCDYIADIDKQDNEFIADGSRYTTRVASCVDSLLSIPNGFLEHGILVLDEADQVLRHLLTGGTCGKNAKRPILLAKFIQTVREAEQVLLASADISDWVINFIASIRNESSVSVLKNIYKANGYDCDFYQSGDDSSTTARLINDVKTGQRLFVPTDSRRKAKRLAKLLYPIIGEQAILEVNSLTSGSDEIREFIQNPDLYLANHREIKVVIATPSMGTGVSIESNYFDKVYGLFYGVSICDNDASQALSRVRQPIPRIVWAKRKGSSYSRFGQSIAAFEITGNIQKLTNATADLLKTHLPVEQLARLNTIDWQGAVMTATATIEAERNRSMSDFRDALQIRLEHEGNNVIIIDSEGDKATRQLLREASQEVKLDEAMAIANAMNLTPAQSQELEAKRDRLKPDQLNALAKFILINWYELESDRLTVDDVLYDRDGRTRTMLTRLEHLLFEGLAVDKDIKGIDRLCQWQADISPVDLAKNSLQLETVKHLHISELLEYVFSGNEWQADTPIVEKVCEALRHYASDVKLILGFTVSAKMTNNQLIGEVLTRRGLKTSSRRVSTGDKVRRVYSLDSGHLQTVRSIIIRREKKRLSKGDNYAVTPLYKLLISGGDTIPSTGDTKHIPIDDHPPDPVDDDEFF